MQKCKVFFRIVFYPQNLQFYDKFVLSLPNLFGRRQMFSIVVFSMDLIRYAMVCNVTYCI